MNLDHISMRFVKAFYYVVGIIFWCIFHYTAFNAKQACWRMAANISQDTAMVSIQATALRTRFVVGVLYGTVRWFASSGCIGPHPCDTALIAVLATAVLAISDSVLHGTLCWQTWVCFEHSKVAWSMTIWRKKFCDIIFDYIVPSWTVPL